SVVRVIVARDKTFSSQAIDGHTDGTGSEPDFRADGIHGQRSFVQERFEDAEIGIAQRCACDALRRVRHQGLEGFHENEPDVNAAGVLFLSGGFTFHRSILLTTIILMSIYFESNK